MVFAERLNSTEQDTPDLTGYERWTFFDRRSSQLLRSEVCHVLEQSNSSEIVVDVVGRSVGCIHVDGIEEGDEIGLTEHIDVVADYQFQTPESACHHLLAFIFNLHTDSNGNDAPPFVFNLLTTRLNHLLNALKH